jgi:succinate dehydrogenase hydrophobic anchor subunit
MGTEPKILRREWTTAEGWRGTRAGMWAWLLQRAAALALVAVIVLHLRNPFLRPVQALLLALVLLHGLLGLRAILLDFGLAVRLHRALFAGAIALGIILFAGFWLWRWY